MGELTLQNFLIISEQTFAYVAAVRFKPFIVAAKVRVIPEEQGRYQYLKYAFWSNLGDGGWFHQ